MRGRRLYAPRGPKYFRCPRCGGETWGTIFGKEDGNTNANAPDTAKGSCNGGCHFKWDRTTQDTLVGIRPSWGSRRKP